MPPGISSLRRKPDFKRPFVDFKKEVQQSIQPTLPLSEYMRNNLHFFSKFRFFPPLAMPFYCLIFFWRIFKWPYSLSHTQSLSLSNTHINTHTHTHTLSPSFTHAPLFFFPIFYSLKVQEWKTETSLFFSILLLLLPK